MYIVSFYHQVPVEIIQRVQQDFEVLNYSIVAQDEDHLELALSKIEKLNIFEVATTVWHGCDGSCITLFFMCDIDEFSDEFYKKYNISFPDCRAKSVNANCYRTKEFSVEYFNKTYKSTAIKKQNIYTLNNNGKIIQTYEWFK